MIVNVTRNEMEMNGDYTSLGFTSQPVEEKSKPIKHLSDKIQEDSMSELFRRVSMYRDVQILRAIADNGFEDPDILPRFYKVTLQGLPGCMAVMRRVDNNDETLVEFYTEVSFKSGMFVADIRTTIYKLPEPRVKLVSGKETIAAIDENGVNIKPIPKNNGQTD